MTLETFPEYSDHQLAILIYAFIHGSITLNENLKMNPPLVVSFEDVHPMVLKGDMRISLDNVSVYKLTDRGIEFVLAIAEGMELE